VKTFDQIAYPQKELVLVYNGNDVPAWSDLGLPGPRSDIVVSHVPGELFAGAALNMGHLQSSGDYCFRIDDDDHYAPNYVTDMILQARSIDAGLFGKPSAPLIFEGEKEVHLKKEATPLAIVSLQQLRSGRSWIGGNSISGLNRFFDSHRYSERSYGAADTDLILNLPDETDVVVALMDGFNMAAERRADLASHTWKNSPDKLKVNRYVLQDFSELVV
jgi:glycosyltransferase involved in cell wall biosynthesis